MKRNSIQFGALAALLFVAGPVLAMEARIDNLSKFGANSYYLNAPYKIDVVLTSQFAGDNPTVTSTYTPLGGSSVTNLSVALKSKTLMSQDAGDVVGAGAVYVYTIDAASMCSGAGSGGSVTKFRAVLNLPGLSNNATEVARLIYCR